MDPLRERIQSDLRGLVACEVRCDNVFTQMYASDASIYQVPPLGVVRPRGVSDVVACVHYAAENEIAIHARGAGTGLAGESLGNGLILDFSHSMRRVLDIDDQTARIQPGVVLATLNRQLAPDRRLFGPDPSTRSVTTMGSVLALDASGSHWPLYGSARSTIQNMQVVLADGEVVELGRHPVSGDGSPGNMRRDELVSRVSDLIGRRQSIIQQHQPQTSVSRSGYHLYDVLDAGPDGGHLDLARMLVGSEGTLALITEATVKTEPMSNYRGVVLFFFNRLEDAAHGALQCKEIGIAACDLMDRRLLSIAREMDVRYELLIPQKAEAMLLVEQHADTPSELRDRLQKLVDHLQLKTKLAFDSNIAMDTEQRNFFWRLTRRVIPTLYRLKGTTRALPFVEDIAIPPEKMPDFLVSMQNILKKHRVTASLFAHASHGQLHLRPFLDMADAEDVRRMQEVASELYRQVLEVGGTISGEHGDGLSRTWFVREQFGEMYDVLREVKRIFDPHNIFNPGKVVADAPQPLTKNLRPVVAAVKEISPQSDQATTNSAVETEPGTASSDLIDLQLNWESEDIAHVARSCNGCGRCRTLSPEERMCPIFRFAPSEEASPRAKANLLRAVLTGQLDASELTSESLKEVADLCVNCHQCRLECPASVDIPKLMIEWKAQYVATNGLKLFDWLLAHSEVVSNLTALVYPITNWIIGNRQMRWVLERLLGIAQGRKLPLFAARSYIRVAQRKRLTTPARSSNKKVLYFIDTYANWHDHQLAEAFVNVLQHNGISVYVHPQQAPSAMGLISIGAIEKAKQIASHNIKILADAVRQGYQIVATEPSAALCLSHEYLNLFDDHDTRLVAENSSEACTFLWGLHQNGNLHLDLKPVNALLGYHAPCHLRAMEVGEPGLELLRLIPGLSVVALEKGCSGMAGNYGIKRENYRNSLRAGWGLISAMRESTIQVGTTECSSCKIQMEQGTVKPTVHPLKVLALAYGLMPEIESLLTSRGKDLIVT